MLPPDRPRPGETLTTFLAGFVFLTVAFFWGLPVGWLYFSALWGC